MSDASLNPCGHPTSEVISSDEGTQYCRACEREAAERGVKRYDMSIETPDHSHHHIEAYESNGGDWVRYDDHAAALRAAERERDDTQRGAQQAEELLTAEVARLEAELAAARESLAEACGCEWDANPEKGLPTSPPTIEESVAHVRSLAAELAASQAREREAYVRGLERAKEIIGEFPMSEWMRIELRREIDAAQAQGPSAEGEGE